MRAIGRARPAAPSRTHRGSCHTLDRALTYLGKHPGQRSEQIQKGIGGDKKAISDALERLRAAKKVTTKGVKRSMTYAV